MLETRQLQVFLAIWENRSFSRAALSVHLSQPTVSGHIRSLEEVLGARLFDRSGRDVTPTKAGQLLHGFARQIFRLQAQAEREMALFLGREKGTLELGGSNIPGQYILPELVGKFKKDLPQIRITLKIGDTSTIAGSVASGELELGMVGATLSKSDLVFEPCLEDEMVLVVPPGHPFAELDEVTLQQLLNEPFIVREKGSGTRLVTEEALRAAGDLELDALRIVAEMGSTEAVRQAAKAGVGCSIVSQRAAVEDLKHGLLYSPQLAGVNLHRQFFFVWHKRRTLSPIAQAFREFLLPRCGDRL